MKKILSILVFFLCCTLYAQQTITLSQLNGTTWRQIVPNRKMSPLTVSLTNTRITRTTNYLRLNESVTNSFAYYLDTKIPTSFISKNVGKKQSGSYIVEYLSNTDSFIYYKVVSLKSDTLTLYYEPDENAIGGNSKRGFNIVYKRVK